MHIKLVVCIVGFAGHVNQHYCSQIWHTLDLGRNAGNCWCVQLHSICLEYPVKVPHTMTIRYTPQLSNIICHNLDSLSLQLP